jgi:hypothetical protein
VGFWGLVGVSTIGVGSEGSEGGSAGFSGPRERTIRTPTFRMREKLTQKISIAIRYSFSRGSKALICIFNSFDTSLGKIPYRTHLATFIKRVMKLLNLRTANEKKRLRNSTLAAA